MSEPIPVRVTRYRCPHCARTASSKGRSRDHIGRCWENPDARGCKTCRHFEPVEGGDIDTGAPFIPEGCAVGVDLSGQPACKGCGGFGWADTSAGGQRPCGPDVSTSHVGDGKAVKAGPIVHCDRWEAAL